MPGTRTETVPLLAIAVPGFGLMPNGQDEYDILGWQPAALCDVPRIFPRVSTSSRRARDLISTRASAATVNACRVISGAFSVYQLGNLPERNIGAQLLWWHQRAQRTVEDFLYGNVSVFRTEPKFSLPDMNIRRPSRTTWFVRKQLWLAVDCLHQLQEFRRNPF
jgi:hypothetical protein